MATVVKQGAKKFKGSAPTVVLPTEMNEPSDDLIDYSMLLYGAKKIGKTALAARFPGALFMALEPGTKALRVYTVPVRNWKEVVATVDAIIADKSNRYKTVVVDTVDLLYEYAFQAVCKQKLIDHPTQENDFGATWKEIRTMFRNQAMRLLNSGRGTIFISHDAEREVELRDGTKIDRVQPTLGKQALEEIEGVVDIVGYYHYEGEERALRIDGIQQVVAGCRLEEKFVRAGGEPRTPGDRIIQIPMGRSAQEAYDNFMAAFRCEQEEVDPFAEAVAEAKPRTMTIRRRTK
jgi:hypothetical protein